MAIDFQTQNGLIGPNSKGAPAYLRAGDFGEQVTLPGGSDYQEMNRQGWVFTGRSTALTALPVNTTLTNSPTLWNAASSGKMVIPLFLNLSPGVIGTPIIFGITLGFLKNTGDGIGTGAPIITFTNAAPVSNLLGRGACNTRFAPGVNTFTTQPANFMDTGLGHYIEGTAATGQLQNMSFDFKGTVIMPPGTSISVGATIASSTTFWTSIIFAEIPLPLYFN